MTSSAVRAAIGGDAGDRIERPKGSRFSGPLQSNPEESGVETAHRDVGSERPWMEGSDEFPTLEGYDLIDILGRGGMGVAYEAFQRSTGRRVAVKFMLPSFASLETARRRFEREVELCARLQHPGIVSVIDSGVRNGQFYYVMEFAPGRPLNEFFPPGQRAPDAVLALMCLICDAVDYAHQRGVLHRDLKPSNIIVDDAGQPRILDFGLAKSFDPGVRLGVEHSLSEPGQMIGTLGYMSPEQSRGRFDLMSVRSDVYSLGVIAYELLTGSLPLPVDGPLSEVLVRIEMQDPVRPSSIRKGISADADAIVLKALEKRPESRYASAAEMARDMRRSLANQTITARRAGVATRVGRWGLRHRAVSAVMLAALIVISAITAAAFRGILNERDRTREERDRTKLILDQTLGVMERIITQADKAFDRHPDPEIQQDRRNILRMADEFFTSLPENATGMGYEYRVAKALRRIGRSYFEEGQNQRAVEIYETSLRYDRIACAQLPGDLEREKHLAFTLMDMTAPKRVLGDGQGALDYAKQSLALLQRLSDADPSDARMAATVACAETDVGMFTLHAGDTSGNGLIRHGLSALTRIAEEHPSDQELGVLLAQRYGVLINLLGNAPAIQQYQWLTDEGLEHVRAVSQRFAESVLVTTHVADTLYLRSWLATTCNDEARAETYALLALATIRPALSRDPNDNLVRMAAIAPVIACANAAGKAGRADEADVLSEQAVGLASPLYELHPAEWDYLMLFVDAAECRGAACFARGRLGEARTWYLKMIELCGKRGGPGFQREYRLGLAYDRIARAHQADHDEEGARAAWVRARDVLFCENHFRVRFKDEVDLLERVNVNLQASTADPASR